MRLKFLLISFFVFPLFFLARSNGGGGPQPPAGSSSDTNQLVEKIKAANAIATERSRHQKENGGIEDEASQQYTRKFNHELQDAAAFFVRAEPLPKTSTNHFVKYTFNQQGLGLDGFRFKNNSAEAKNFAWVFAYDSPNGFEWYILPVEGEMEGFRYFWNSPEPFAEMPWRHSASRFLTVAQSLDGAEILPGKEYIIWMKFRDDKPKDFFVAFNLIPPDMPLDGSSDIEKAVGLR